MPDIIKDICLIPARGGSKRIPKKNIVDFHGKPMLAYTIEAAQRSGLFGEHIYVSSDSEEILKVASSHGAKVVRRPAEFSGDTASLEDVTQHILREVGQTTFENLCLLMPNCPLRIGEDVIASHARFVESEANCLMSVLKYEWLYPFWALHEQDGKLDFFFGKKYLVDSKLLPRDIYCPSGAIRWVKIKNFLKENKYYGKDLAKYVLQFERGADVDTYEDLELARKLYPLVYPSNT